MFDDAEQAHGLWLIAGSLVKKIIIGDFLAQNIVKRVFDNPERFSSLEVLNFDRPYAARNLQDFWHRWHISLSTRLRDYLCIR